MEEKETLISVIIPAYNVAPWLERCVNSVCGQTWRRLEILLVDDGSSDGTGALCEELARRDGRIRVFHTPNGGSSRARNVGVRAARGEYLGFVDSDDWIDPAMYALLLETAGSSGAKIVSASRDEIDEGGNRRADVCTPPKEVTFSPPQEFLRELLLHRGDCSFCTKLVKRELFENLSFPEGELNEDFFLLVKMLPLAGGVVTLPQQFYHVYYRPESNTRRRDRNDFPQVFTDIVNHADMAQQFVADHFPQLGKEAVRFGLIQRLDYLLHIPLGQMKKENRFYRQVVLWLRRHLSDILTNPYLTFKNRLYLLLLAAAPKLVRTVHSWKMALA